MGLIVTPVIATPYHLRYLVLESGVGPGGTAVITDQGLASPDLQTDAVPGPLKTALRAAGFTVAAQVTGFFYLSPLLRVSVSTPPGFLGHAPFEDNFMVSSGFSGSNGEPEISIGSNGVVGTWFLDFEFLHSFDR